MGAICFPPLLPIEKYASSLESALSGILVSSWLLGTLRRNIEHPRLYMWVDQLRGDAEKRSPSLTPRLEACAFVTVTVPVFLLTDWRVMVLSDPRKENSSTPERK